MDDGKSGPVSQRISGLTTSTEMVFGQVCRSLNTVTLCIGSDTFSHCSLEIFRSEGSVTSQNLEILRRKVGISLDSTVRFGLYLVWEEMSVFGHIP